MRFRVEQLLPVTLEAAEAAYVDPGFYATMGGTGPIGKPEVLHRHDEGGRVELAVRYRFTGHLAAPARAVLDPAKLTWVIDSVMVKSQHRVDFTMVPDHYPGRLQCVGSYRFEEAPGGTRQVIEGDLVVHALLVAGAVERAIVLGMRQHMAQEAELVARYVAGRA